MPDRFEADEDTIHWRVSLNSRQTGLEGRVAKLEEVATEHNLPARLDDLEKYGCPVAQRLQGDMRGLESRVLQLENAPKAIEAAEKQRQNRVLMWAGIGGCVYMVVTTILTIALAVLSTIISIWITQH